MSINISHCAKRIVEFTCSKTPIFFFGRNSSLPYHYTITYAETGSEYNSRYNSAPHDWGEARNPEEIIQKLKNGYCTVCGNKMHCMRDSITKNGDSKKKPRKLSIDEIINN